MNVQKISRPGENLRPLFLLLLLLALILFTAQAEGANSITSPDTAGAVGQYTSLALDADGNPVVSYFDFSNTNLKLLHCNDPNCAGGDDSITSPDTAGTVGQYTSLALDADGNPVVSYYDNTNADLKLLHCNDPNCAGGDDSITSPDTAGVVGVYSSLALDGSGNPVISYYDDTWDDLKLMHCNDPNCAGGDESITSPDTAGVVGLFTSLVLDGSGNPVVSYYDDTSDDLKLLHCNDPYCAGGDESITSPDTAGTVGWYSSLALDGSGNPVISYYDFSNANLKLLRCNDPNCAGGDDSITIPDTGNAGQFSSLALDGSGNPVVSYYDAGSGDLKLLHCNDPNCAGGDESITSPDTVNHIGQYTSLALDSSGNPVVSYFDAGFGDLELLHCIDPNCDGAAPSDSTAPDIIAFISGTLGNNGWYTGDVTVSWSVSDPESAVSSTSGCDPITIDDDTAGTTLTCQATSAGGTASDSVTVQRDATAPTVSVTGVADGATYTLGSVPAAGCDTQDALSGVGAPASLSVTGGNANGTGSFTAACNGAADNAGNTAGPVTVTYNVVLYNFSGFFSPIDNPPTFNQVKAGQAIPVKFSLNGDQGLDILAAGYPASQAIACDSNAPVNDVEETSTAGSSSLSYDPAEDQYTYVWKTPKGWSGTCRQLLVRLEDGAEHTALFQFK